MKRRWLKHRVHVVYLLLKYCAKPSSNPTAWLLLSPGVQGALSTKASVRGARGALRIPYTLVPFTIWNKNRV